MTMNCKLVYKNLLKTIAFIAYIPVAIVLALVFGDFKDKWDMISKKINNL
ncbi:hypothetical protein [Tepidibacter hydrothermalis]|uniref:Uncharacterized protein n=1 Tax=Tepidibacter hydrothermalis TaxID=3036126 RepID=A0ABY8EAD5_9FIRM|nr:hypothetical protein [Tepidibacter hydrothermalis]WFD09906.1 hypothetical protein P4S50_16235 [Tepidibacter hydrothermalis]